MQSPVAATSANLLVRADQWLLLKVNRDMHSPALDHLALFSREATTWAPLYLFLIIFMAMNHGKQGWWWVVTALALVGVSDLISSHVIKEIFHRTRPCRDPFMAHQIRFIASTCGMNGSFVSSHASNHFTIATFIYGTLGKTKHQWGFIYLWAVLICWAQVYVGVHYPFDILGGALIGTLIGLFGSSFFGKKIGLTISSKA